ncbi:ABC transporter ATP-binding protein [Auraticoccus monumenti]|uniref:Oligopeptide transport system ATP-binding protein n=1 Tax=Auraticoccus monumenti TaxID=675864 RepID=A0A1G6TWY3_9ACTN|nr:ABC transporter ATP-binding protein [Auraticoccus monumenti]SDD33620.1 oligopeptide transport system ATP-binding protein [Auraticoccus monumenti]
MSEPVLSLRGLSIEFATSRGVVRAVQDVSLDVVGGRTLALLGESGSGKSVTAQAVMGVLDSPPGRVTAGQVLLRGRDLLTVPAAERRKANGEVLSMVFQDSMSSLNPVFTVGEQIAELLRVRRGSSRRVAWAGAVELMDRVRIPAPAQRARDYPHQFSGGMRQRVMIAMAIALDPAVLIADEPTTALDVTVQAQIMELLRQLQEETGMGLVLITHDLGVVAEVADEVAIMYAGRIVEQGPIHQLFAHPSHPYTRGLLRSIPRPDRDDDVLWAIPGAPPDLLHLASGCSFRSRCDVPVQRCADERPDLQVPHGSPSQRSACHRREEVLGGLV